MTIYQAAERQIVREHRCRGREVEACYLSDGWHVWGVWGERIYRTTILALRAARTEDAAHETLAHPAAR